MKEEVIWYKRILKLNDTIHRLIISATRQDLAKKRKFHMAIENIVDVMKTKNPKYKEEGLTTP